MRVALIDNMNNNFFALARYLRDAGIDAHLYVIPGSLPHFVPGADTFEDVSRMDWIHVFPCPYDASGWTKAAKTDWSEFQEFDLIIACGYAMAFLHQAGIRVDLFKPYGGDICDPVHQPFRLAETFGSLRSSLKALEMHLDGVRRARTTLLAKDFHPSAHAAEKLGIPVLDATVPMLYPSAGPVPAELFQELADEEFVVFHHSRHLWKSDRDAPPDFDRFGGIKRNDRVIRAFATFAKRHPGIRARLVLFEYGPDVDSSKELVQRLEIASRVTWYPLAPRRVIMAGLRYATFGTGAFREGITGMNGVGFEVLASGVPLVSHMNNSLDAPSSPYFKAPILDALTEEDLLAHFERWRTEPEAIQAAGEAGRRWFQKHLGQGLAERYVRLLRFLHEHPEATCADPGCAAALGSRLLPPPPRVRSFDLDLAFHALPQEAENGNREMHDRLRSLCAEANQYGPLTPPPPAEVTADRSTASPVAWMTTGNPFAETSRLRPVLLKCTALRHLWGRPVPYQTDTGPLVAPASLRQIQQAPAEQVIPAMLNFYRQVDERGLFAAFVTEDLGLAHRLVAAGVLRRPFLVHLGMPQLAALEARELPRVWTQAENLHVIVRHPSMRARLKALGMPASRLFLLPGCVRASREGPFVARGTEAAILNPDAGPATRFLAEALRARAAEARSSLFVVYLACPPTTHTNGRKEIQALEKLPNVYLVRHASRHQVVTACQGVDAVWLADPERPETDLEVDALEAGLTLKTPARPDPFTPALPPTGVHQTLRALLGGTQLR